MSWILYNEFEGYDYGIRTIAYHHVIRLQLL